MAEKIRVAIAGATGYGGVEAVRWLSRHPAAELVYLGSESYAGQKMGAVYPHLRQVDCVLRRFDCAEVAGAADVAMLAVPAGQAMQMVPQLLDAGVKVIDFSPDFRLKRPEVYKQYYRVDHCSADLLGEAVYGLPEAHRREIAQARLVAVPGCYPTGALIPLLPVLRAGLVKHEGIVVDSKSGISGAGRTSLELRYHFPEANEDVTAYSVASHRHTPEMEQEIGLVVNGEVAVCFTPHLIPMTRGIFSTVYAPLADGRTAADMIECLRSAYAADPFVAVLDEDGMPHTKATAGSNQCQISARVDERTGRAILLSAIDNLGKGLAGTAVQCMNLMFGLPESTGLETASVYP